LLIDRDEVEIFKERAVGGVCNRPQSIFPKLRYHTDRCVSWQWLRWSFIFGGLQEIEML